MTDGHIWLLGSLLAGLPFAVWAWRHCDAPKLPVNRHHAPPETPCWTEETVHADGLSYGRSGCYHARLADMERRARRGEFDTPG